MQGRGAQLRKLKLEDRKEWRLLGDHADGDAESLIAGVLMLVVEGLAFVFAGYVDLAGKP